MYIVSLRILENNICSLAPTYPLLCFGRSIFRINKYGSFSEGNKSPVFHCSHLKVSNCNTVVSKKRRNAVKNTINILDGVSQNLRMINGRFKTPSGHFFCQIHEYLSQNWGSDSHFVVLSKSESQFCERYSCSWQKNDQKWS